MAALGVAAWGALSWFVCQFGQEAFALNPPREMPRFVAGLLTSIAFSLLRDWANVAAALGCGAAAGEGEGWLEEEADVVSIAQARAHRSAVLSCFLKRKT